MNEVKELPNGTHLVGGVLAVEPHGKRFKIRHAVTNSVLEIIGTRAVALKRAQFLLESGRVSE